jgi:hypothetical protein
LKRNYMWRVREQKRSNTTALNSQQCLIRFITEQHVEMSAHPSVIWRLTRCYPKCCLADFPCGFLQTVSRRKGQLRKCQGASTRIKVPVRVNVRRRVCPPAPWFPTNSSNPAFFLFFFFFNNQNQADCSYDMKRAYPMISPH